MNYIKEINSFYDWLETNSVSDSAITLWHAMMHVNNKAGWKVEFTVASSVLCLKSGLSNSQFKRARNILKQSGRIEWRERKGNQSAIYSICEFAVQYEPQTVPQHVPQSVPQHVPQSVPITKLNKTKLNLLLEKEAKGDFCENEKILINPENPKEKSSAKKEKFNFKDAMLKFGFDEELTEEFLTIRKSKKGINSELAFKNFINQIEKTKQDKNEVLKIITEKQWKGFQADWLNNTENGTNGNNYNGKNSSSKIDGTAAILAGKINYSEFT